MPNSGEGTADARVSPQSRAQDLHAAFSDPDVTVVLAVIGGDHAVELLSHLNFDLIRANPNVFQGYSDVTVLHYRAEDPQLHRHPHARWSRHESMPRPAP